MDSPAARLEVDVDPRSPAARSPQAYLTLVGMALAALWAPWSYGVPFALPVLFVWLGLRAVRNDPKEPYRVSIHDDAVVVRSPFCVARTPLTNVRRVVETADAFVLALPSGDVTIPRAALGSDPRWLLDVLPEHVARESAPALSGAKPSAGKVLVIWLALLTFFVALYFVVRPR